MYKINPFSFFIGSSKETVCVDGRFILSAFLLKVIFNFFNVCIL